MGLRLRLEERTTERWAWPGWRLAGAALGGVLLTVLTLLLFYRAGGLVLAAPPVIVQGDKLQLIGGEGVSTPAGLEIRQAGPQGWAMVQGPARLAQAELYRLFFWRIEGLPPGREIRLIWVTQAEPQTPRQRILSLAELEGGGLDLGAEPDWQGRIAAIGLAVRGPFSQPLIIHHLELRPVTPTTAALLRWMAADWISFEGWSQRSINYVSGAPLGALFPPVLMVALWIGFSAGLYALFNPRRRTPDVLWPYLALFLIGWLALDLRWQGDLHQRLLQTAEDFAGKNAEDRQLAALDGELYRFLRDVRQRLPQQPVRLFILSADPAGFWAGRTRYHLLPHNSYAGFSRLPPASKIRAGDYVLILAPFTGARYDPEQKMLQFKEGKLPVERLHTAARGALFRVREEG